MNDEELKQLASAGTGDSASELLALLKRVRDAERRSCADTARREGKRLCRDPDSLQYRVAHSIADLIEGKK